MRLGGRLAAAIDILSDIETRHRPVADALKDWGLSHRFAGSGDRAAIGNIVYDALRLKLSHQWLMDSDAPAAMAYAVIYRQWKIAPDEVAHALEGDRFAPPPPAPEWLASWQEKDLTSAPHHVQADMPEWLISSLMSAFGEDWLAEARALNERPPLDLRVNTLKADRAKVAKAMARTGAHPAPTAPHGLRIDPVAGPQRHPNVTAELAYQKGWFEVQDEGSQIVAALFGAAAGENVLDFCAGGGGKTLAMAAAMENKGQVHAYDADRGRLAPIIERLKRAGTRNVQVHDAADDLAMLAGRMDRVLVDAPCTGSGTWRRRPDTKWRLTARNVEERLAQQAAVLSSASRYVRPGGTLAYVTCSVLPEENEVQARRFLAENVDFSAEAAADLWQTHIGETGARPRMTTQGGLALTPALSGTDGFFFAVFKRTA
ncbi:RsmB/NOP family class I SAM-dependent RNA methyltransferase [Pararhizobium haloflavum]|uniref:RsmB/NOP family class I SAM-dependent RNA methyltransferase n=1 Tax=Pararhizobium haloflavum TaxID=2037914 RepID=UPI000C19B09A|nr:RsmB/NOP family class I SAM-dependent RNA methyltransferase [Pararhizobium haloflavum]